MKNLLCLEELIIFQIFLQSFEVLHFLRILKMGIHKHGIVEEANEEIVNMEHHNLRKVHEGERFHPIANSFCSYAG